MIVIDWVPQAKADEFHVLLLLVLLVSISCTRKTRVASVARGERPSRALPYRTE
jgi:hypothetical protein